MPRMKASVARMELYGIRDEWCIESPGFHCAPSGLLANASERDKQIAGKATEALQRIAKGSEFNARRVANFGVKIDNPKPKDDARQSHQLGR